MNLTNHTKSYFYTQNFVHTKLTHMRGRVTINSVQKKIISISHVQKKFFKKKFLSQKILHKKLYIRKNFSKNFLNQKSLHPPTKYLSP